jgi:putative membrane protein
MKKLSTIAMIALAVWMFQACSGNTKTDSKAAADSANAVNDSSKNDTSKKMTMVVEKEDAQFATEAASGGMAEVALGKLAQEKAVNSKVKNFGAMMVMDHSKANEAFKGIAKSKNITLPAAPGAEEQKTMDELSKKSGADFDKAYVSDMIEDHKKDIKAFEAASKTCKDPEIKAFAIKTLPVLRKHLDAINAIHDSMK